MKTKFCLMTFEDYIGMKKRIKQLEDGINRALTIYDMDKLDDIIGSGHAMANILKKELEQK